MHLYIRLIITLIKPACGAGRTLKELVDPCCRGSKFSSAFRAIGTDTSGTVQWPPVTCTTLDVIFTCLRLGTNVYHLSSLRNTGLVKISEPFLKSTLCPYLAHE